MTASFSLRRAVRVTGPIGCALFVVLALGMIARTPAVGVADNSDFRRVTEPAGLAHSVPLADLLQRFVDPSYVVVETAWERGISSPACVAWLARELDVAFGSEPGSVAIQSVGLVYLALLFGAIAAICWRERTLWLLGAVVLWVVTDPGYLLYLNSFYAEPALIVALASIALWLCRFGELGELLAARGSARTGPLVILFGLLALVGFSKLLFSLLPLALLVVLLPELWRSRRRVQRVPLVFAAGLLAIAVSAPVYFAGHEVLRAERTNAYHRVFTGIAVVAGDPEKTLASFGIPRDRLKLVGKSHFTLSAEESAWAGGATVWRTLGAYLTDPLAAWRGAAKVAGSLSAQRTIRSGQYTLEESDGKRRFYPARAWHFSTWRNHVLGSSLGIGLVWLGALGWSVARLRRGMKPRLLALAWLLLVVPIEALGAVLGDGFFGLHRHLLAARLALDLALVLLLCDVAAVLVTLPRNATARGSSSRSPSGSR